MDGQWLQVLITKLRHFAPTTAQLICISATMRGLDGVIDWLDATLFKTDFRPIQLEEHVVLGQAMFRVNGTLPAPADFADTSIVSTHLPSLSDVPAFPNDMGDVLDGAGLHLTRVLPSPASNVMRKGARQIQIGDHIALQLAMEGMAVRTLRYSSHAGRDPAEWCCPSTGPAALCQCVQEATGGCLVFCKSRKGCGCLPSCGAESFRTQSCRASVSWWNFSYSLLHQHPCGRWRRTRSMPWALQVVAACMRTPHGPSACSELLIHARGMQVSICLQAFASLNATMTAMD